MIMPWLLQVASKQCKHCDDVYCDSCFKHLHAPLAGARTLFIPLLEHCRRCRFTAVRYVQHAPVCASPALSLVT